MLLPKECRVGMINLAVFIFTLTEKKNIETNDALVYDRREAVFLASRATRSASMKP